MEDTLKTLINHIVDFKYTDYERGFLQREELYRGVVIFVGNVHDYLVFQHIEIHVYCPLLKKIIILKQIDRGISSLLSYGIIKVHNEFML